MTKKKYRDDKGEYYGERNEEGYVVKKYTNDNQNEYVEKKYINESPNEYVEKKYMEASQEVGNKKRGIPLVPILLVLLTLGGYFAYSSFFTRPSVDLSNYEVTFSAKGNNGQGTPVAKVSGIPVIENIDSESQEEINAIDKVLMGPTIIYSKQSGLSNGDKVDVSIELDEEGVKESGVNVKGEFKKTFTVSGLKEANGADTSSNKSDSETSTTSANDKKETRSNEPNKNWFAVDGQHRAANGNHPDTQLKNGFNAWAAGEGLSLERMKGGSVFGGTTLGNKIDYNGKQIDLRFIRYYGETQETIAAGEILKDTYNVVGIFSDKSSVIYITAIYNGKAQVFKSELSAGKPKTKNGLIVFEDADNSEVKNMLQDVIDGMK